MRQMVDLEIARQLPDLSQGSYSPPRQRRRLPRWLSLALRITLALFVTVTLALTALILPLRWWDGYTTSFMNENQNQPVVHEWVDLDHISRYPVAAAIVLEDSFLGDRYLAFDISDFVTTAKLYMSGENVAGGSTIPQQLVKNLYLTESRTAWRKAPEAVLALAFNVVVHDARIMELYLNYAQFGPKLYGICGASWYYFNTAPWNLTLYQASQIAAILPFPSEARRVDTPEGGLFVLGPNTTDTFNYRLNAVEERIEYMGGYRAIMDGIGIPDDASDHADERDSGASCSTMPTQVQQLLIEDGYVY